MVDLDTICSYRKDGTLNCKPPYKTILLEDGSSLNLGKLNERKKDGSLVFEGKYMSSEFLGLRIPLYSIFVILNPDGSFKGYSRI